MLFSDVWEKSSKPGTNNISDLIFSRNVSEVNKGREQRVGRRGRGEGNHGRIQQENGMGAGQCCLFSSPISIDKIFRFFYFFLDVSFNLGNRKSLQPTFKSRRFSHSRKEREDKEAYCPLYNPDLSCSLRQNLALDHTHTEAEITLEDL